ncbi:MAG TPA: hypothetical protein VI819_03655 [Patescibacteria group bacterium]|nr:hypothetical protein [Patescibacteria group bacterium]
MPEQHPIPQQIASYQFKLVGDMTLKQFTQLAGGALISLLLYASPLHPFIKWPLIVLSFLFGVALAFLPIEDRPLSTWVFIFFRSIYSPTYFIWNKAVNPKDYFLPEEGEKTTPASVKIAEKKEEVKELLETSVRTSPAIEKLEEKEKTFLSSVTQQFISPGSTVVVSTTPVHTFTSLQTPFQPKTVKPPTTDVKIPETQTIKIEPIAQQAVKASPASPDLQVGMNTRSVSPYTYSKIQSPQQVQSQGFSPDVTPPAPPTRPNVVVGQVVDQNGRIVEGAILEIKDMDGRPVRALKTNRIGHFMIATPLFAGKYVIVTEKDGYEFPNHEFEAKDDLLKPVVIIAKKGSAPVEPEIKFPGEPAVQRPKEEADFMKDFKL